MTDSVGLAPLDPPYVPGFLHLKGIAMKRFAILAVFLAGAVLPTPAAAQTKITKNVSNEQIESILQGLQLKFSKVEPKGKDSASMYFDFERGERPCRLKNYGTDLWIESTIEKALKLEDINRWNADAKFSRLVLITENNKTIVSLEAQLDCLGGVTEPMVRQFIVRFEAEAKRFTKFVK
jgi:hypothetical protein